MHHASRLVLTGTTRLITGLLACSTWALFTRFILPQHTTDSLLPKPDGNRASLA